VEAAFPAQKVINSRFCHSKMPLKFTIPNRKAGLDSEYAQIIIAVSTRARQEKGITEVGANR
jgi:hypothetical protein